MRLAVADTGPLHYLVLIGEIGILSALVGEVLIPPEVRAELDRPRTPAPVRWWIAAPPSWLRVHAAPPAADPARRATRTARPAGCACAARRHELPRSAGAARCHARRGSCAPGEKGDAWRMTWSSKASSLPSPVCPRPPCRFPPGRFRTWWHEAALRRPSESRLPIARSSRHRGFGSEETMCRSVLRVLATAPQDDRSRFSP